MLADLRLMGLQISTSQRATRKRIWGSILIRERFTKRNSHLVLRNTGILCLTVQRLSNFACDTHGQVKKHQMTVG